MKINKVRMDVRSVPIKSAIDNEIKGWINMFDDGKMLENGKVHKDLHDAILARVVPSTSQATI